MYMQKGGAATYLFIVLEARNQDLWNVGQEAAFQDGKHRRYLLIRRLFQPWRLEQPKSGGQCHSARSISCSPSWEPSTFLIAVRPAVSSDRLTFTHAVRGAHRAILQGSLFIRSRESESVGKELPLACLSVLHHHWTPYRGRRSWWWWRWWLKYSVWGK